MSQVKFKTTLNGKPVEVMAGWDIPLQGFFLTVFDLAEDAEEECIYSGMDDPKTRMGFMPKTDYFRDILATEYGIVAPEGFWDLVEKREGNTVHVL